MSGHQGQAKLQEQGIHSTLLLSVRHILVATPLRPGMLIRIPPTSRDSGLISTSAFESPGKTTLEKQEHASIPPLAPEKK